MRKIRSGMVLGWRWRRNPLRRRSDAAEAWIVLATWTLATAGAAASGVVAAQAVGQAAEQARAGRTAVSAVMVEAVPGLQGIRLERTQATVRWTDSNGKVRTGTTDVAPGSAVGDTVRVWTDGHGHLVSSPPSAAEGTARSVLAGVWVAGAAGLVVLGTGRVIRLRVERRATEGWDEDWARADRQWGSTTG